jgi:Uma2 family endonuclease
MATATEPRTASQPDEQRFLLRGVGWEGYEKVLDVVGDRHVRVTYDRGDLELMSPSYEHDQYGNLFGRVIETVTEELRVPCRGVGSTTWRRQVKDRGLEPDECYYLANAPRVRGKRTSIDLNVDPPPDLAIEIEISRSALDRMGVYAALGVPEVWRFDGETLRVEVLQADGTYARADVGPGLPMLPLDEVVRWVELGASGDDHSAWGRSLREWVRAELVPREARP